jgi:hypothetical protein
MHTFWTRVVTKLEYDSTNKKFIFLKNKLFKCKENRVEVDKDYIMYSTEPILRNQYANVIDVKGMKLYGLVFQEPWKEKDLFAELVNEKTIPTHKLKTTRAFTTFFFNNKK